MPGPLIRQTMERQPSHLLHDGAIPQKESVSTLVWFITSLLDANFENIVPVPAQRNRERGITITGNVLNAALELVGNVNSDELSLVADAEEDGATRGICESYYFSVESSHSLF